MNLNLYIKSGLPTYTAHSNNLKYGMDPLIKNKLVDIYTWDWLLDSFRERWTLISYHWKPRLDKRNVLEMGILDQEEFIYKLIKDL